MNEEIKNIDLIDKIEVLSSELEVVKNNLLILSDFFTTLPDEKNLISYIDLITQHSLYTSLLSLITDKVETLGEDLTKLINIKRG